MQTLRECNLSIILPVYNLEDYITPMLTALKAQKHSYNVEIIFVLNNCTDNTEQVIRDSGLDCTIISCTIQGCGPARNAGFEMARGEYIWFLDGDDWLLSDTAIQDVLDKAYFEDLNVLYIPFQSELYRGQYFSMVAQYLLRRSFVEEFRFPDYQPAEDDAYMDAVLRKAGFNRWNYFQLPRVNRPLWFYNYLREGSNMYRVNILGEKI